MAKKKCKKKEKGTIGRLSSFASVESYDGPCRESKKILKQRLKNAKKVMREGTDFLNGIDMTYEAKQQAIGSLYQSYRRLEVQLKEY